MPARWRSSQRESAPGPESGRSGARPPGPYRRKGCASRCADAYHSRPPIQAAEQQRACHQGPAALRRAASWPSEPAQSPKGRPPVGPLRLSGHSRRALLQLCSGGHGSRPADLPFVSHAVQSCVFSPTARPTPLARPLRLTLRTAFQSPADRPGPPCCAPPAPVRRPCSPSGWRSSPDARPRRSRSSIRLTAACAWFSSWLTWPDRIGQQIGKGSRSGALAGSGSKSRRSCSQLLASASIRGSEPLIAPVMHRFIPDCILRPQLHRPVDPVPSPYGWLNLCSHTSQQCAAYDLAISSADAIMPFSACTAELFRPYARVAPIRSTISVRGLMSGYETYPSGPASGCPGS
jgi:hypothetical protein